MPVSTALSPGDLLASELAARHWEVSDLAARMDTSIDVAQGLVDGTVPVCPSLSKKIGAAMGGSDHLWLKLQRRYDHWLTHVAADDTRAPA